MPWKAPSLFSAIFFGEDKEATADIEPKPHMSQFDQFHFFFHESTLLVSPHVRVLFFTNFRPIKSVENL